MAFSKRLLRRRGSTGRALEASRVYQVSLSPSIRKRRLFCQTAAIYCLQLFPVHTINAIDNPRSFAVSPPVVKSRGYSQRPFLVTTRRRFGEYEKKQDQRMVLSALQNLVRRLEEWEPNLAFPSSTLEDDLRSSSEVVLDSPSDSPGTTTSTTSNALSVEEYARLFCTGYLRLPPLQLGWIAKNAFQNVRDDSIIWECNRSAVVHFLANDCGLSATTSPALLRMLEDLKTQPMEKTLRECLEKSWTPKFAQVFQCLLEQNSSQAIPMLVQLRGDILRLMTVLRTPKNDDGGGVGQQLKESLQQLEAHIRRLLSTWFSPGMLDTRRITYNTTSAGVIEKIAVKEAVHPMKSLDDLRKRLGPERRVFALFHPLMPDEPLVILHVHLETKPDHIPSAMEHVLTTTTTEEPSEMPLKPLVATFYSISNTQSGLTRGLGLGEFLIKEAVQQLQQEFPTSLHTFVTLSPMPGFRKWVESIVPMDGTCSSDQEWAENLAARGVISASSIQQFTLVRPLLEKLLISGKSSDDDKEDGSIERQLDEAGDSLIALAAHYLVTAKNLRSGKPLDPVTGFHVSNGAEVYRINFAADLSRKGLLRSFGVMVNYRYQLDKIESNKAGFESSHYEQISMSDSVQDLLPVST